jgi:thiol-disulfide isomerase/thioredoxin
MKTFMVSALFFCALLALAAPSRAGEEEQASIFEGVMLTDLDGNKAAIDSLLDRGPLLVNFWATWCSPCRLEMPHLEKLYREFAPKGVQFAAVSVDRKGYNDRVKAFLEKHGMTVPSYMDSDTRLAKGFKVRAIPTTIIILKDRSQYHRNQGYRAGDEVVLRKRLQALVEAGEAGGEEVAGEEKGASGAGAGAAEAAVETEPAPPAEAGD